MSTLAVAAALLLPLPLGAAVLVGLLGRPRGADAWLGALGAGWILGAMLLSLAIAAFAAGAPADVFGQLAPWIAAVAVAAVVLAWRRRVSASAAAADGEWRVVTFGCIALLAVHFALVVWQARLLPTLPWDAWTTWIGKAQAWYAAPTWSEFVTPDAWLAADDPNVRATLAPHYPEAIPRLAVWVASAAGAFDTGAVNAWWPLLWLALGAALFGASRRDGMRRDAAAAAAFAALSLPLVNAHVALAGYADLWMAALVALAAIHLSRGLRERRWADVLAGVLFAALLPAVKHEGAVWLLCLAAASVWTALSPRWRIALPLAALIVVASGLMLGGLPIPAPGLGIVTLRWGAIDIPGIGELALFWRPVLPQVLSTLFALPNWHLLWFALPVVLAMRAGRLVRDRGDTAVAAFLALGFSFLFVLFFFTDASAWAENLTSVNRVLLHVAPLTAWWLVRLSSPAPTDTDRASGG